MLAIIALLGWIPVVIVLFMMWPARKAAATAVIGAWLFIPPLAIQIPGFSDYSRSTAAVLGVLLGTLCTRMDRVTSFRPRWFDLPILAWCLCGIVSALRNDLGLYDGLSDAMGTTISWGFPYLIGRIYFGNPEDLRFFNVAVIVGGLSYVLPCIYESQMSPQLLAKIYGVDHWMGMRYGGYRPHVFFWTGLECGMFMTAVSLTAWWLWKCGALKKLGLFPMGSVLLPVLLATTVICRATGALILLLGGVGLLWGSTRFQTRLLLAGLLLVGPAYAAVRIPNLWTGQSAVDLAKALVGPDRAESLEYRFMCENLLAAKAMGQPIFGWGGWSRSAVYFNADQEWRTLVPTDGLWISILGSKGIVGLTLLYSALVLPAILFLHRFPARLWGDPRLAAGSLAAAFLGLYMIDCLMNGFVNIIYLTMAGGLASLEPSQLREYAAGSGDEAVRRRAAAGMQPGVVGVGAAAAAPSGGRLAVAERCRTLGRSFKQEGRLDEAESSWTQALDLLTAPMDAEPDIPGLRPLWCDCANDLAWLQANHPDPARRDPEAAVARARRMVEVYPEAQTYWNTLGVAYYRAGDDTSAVAALDRATALGGGTAFDDVFLALAHARLGDLEAAQLAFARALVRAERDYPGHAELAGFCREARSVLARGPGTPAAVR